ncbi:MAG: phage tail tip lysozyme [Candidatus Limivicinus sp.]|jgi:hypothetical protein
MGLIFLPGCSGEKVSAAVDIVSGAVDDMRDLKPTPTPEGTPAPAPTPTPSPSPTPEPTPSATPEPTPTPKPTPRSDIFLTGAEQAAYLRLEPCSTRSTDEQRNHFIAVVESGLTEKIDTSRVVPELCEGIIYGEEANAGFLLSCSDISGLSDAGMFDIFPDCSMQYRYLTEINGFARCPLTELIPFGGYIEAVPGDIIFWLNEEGRAVNYGIVTAVDDAYVRTVLSRTDGSSGALDLNWANLGEKCIGGGVLVHPVYPSIEQYIYFFCVNELRYSPAAACGVMANIYKESSFRCEIEAEGSYGLCQWLGHRRTDLLNWCSRNGFDHNSLYGQLKYMEYELSLDKYKALDEFMRGLGNTAEDAYNAGREWCYKFEQPGDIANIGRDRGLLSRDTFYPIYSQYD